MTKMRFLSSLVFLSVLVPAIAAHALLVPTLAVHSQFANLSESLWYTQPAEKWTDALPIGNGRMGAMVFGGVPDERIQFNEDTLWKGQPHDYVRAGAHDHLAEIQQLLFAGKTEEAQDLARKTFLSDPVRQKAYQPFGDLHFHFPGLTNVTDYRRELDLASGIASVTYRANGVGYREDAFASYPDQAIVLHFTADKPGSISFTLTLDSPQTNSATAPISLDTLALSGQVEAGGLRFESCARVIHDGGELAAGEKQFTVKNADAATVILVAATSFKNFQDISADPSQRCAATLANVANTHFENLLADHEADYQKLFNRVALGLGHTARADLPTDKRLEAVHESGLDGDPAFAALYFDYGRYLLISSSREGGQPANLQGLWNDELAPPWESKWTLNINLEMNYWPAELCNLTECTPPLFALIDDLAVSGGRTAKEQYGARGWVVNHNTDLWRGTAPINNIDGVWPTGGAWLCYHLWEHYLFTRDTNFLARAYPDMKGASQFFMDYLIKDPKTGFLVTSPSFSPEEGGMCYGPTMDNQLIRALMNNTIAAAGILHTDDTFAVELGNIRDLVPPNQVGQNGQLQEWLTDIDVPNNNHRHMSPLWAVYPGAEITPDDPKIWNAAKVLLKWRAGGSTGWSYAWRIPLWARTDDGEYAYQQLTGLYQKRTLPNLFDLCGPFQIDGNFGATAGIAEMLLQSQWTEKHDGADVRIVSLLPALPKEWPTGSAIGLCARDGFVLDMAWDKGALMHVVLHSKLGRPCVLRYSGHETALDTKAGENYAFDGELVPMNKN
jgi:alpha-L-fucosidase 2